MARTPVRPIRNKRDYEAALDEIERYFENEPAPGTPEAAALYAVRPKEGYFKVSDTGTISVGEDGRTKFAAGPGKHQHLIADPALT